MAVIRVPYKDQAERQQVIIDQSIAGNVAIGEEKHVDGNAMLFGDPDEMTARAKRTAIEFADNRTVKGREFRLITGLIRLLVQQGVIDINSIPPKMRNIYNQIIMREDEADA